MIFFTSNCEQDWTLSTVIVFTSCATISVTTIKNDTKKLADAKGYVVFYNSNDMDLRKKVEAYVQSELVANGKKAISSFTLFPPLKEYSDNEVQQGCMENDCNFRIVITESASSTETAYIIVSGSIVPVASQNTSYDVFIQDLTDNQIVMRSTIKTEGDELKYILKRFAVRIVNEIEKEESRENNINE